MVLRGRAQSLTATVVVMASLILGGCGGDEAAPEVCDGVDALTTSVEDLRNVAVGEGALASLQDKVTQVRTDVTELVDAAEEEYAAEIDSVDQALSAVGASLDAAVATPSGPSLAAVGAALQSLRTSVSALTDAVQGSC